MWEYVKKYEIDFTRNQLLSYKRGKVLTHDVNIQLTSLDYRCVLVPLYCGHFQYNGNCYDVIVHGRSGQISAARPYMGESYCRSILDRLPSFHK
jgi:hypothetical protein